MSALSCDWLLIGEKDGVTTVLFREEDIYDREAEMMGDRLLSLIASGVRKMLINFTGVTLFSSAALGKLINVEKQLENLGGTLILCGMNEFVRDKFAITRLDQFFTIIPSHREALKKF